ncbi:hypothetical protein BDZ94DRAFT_1249065 [Collybia nuda]|uniref:Uncharacterized protein n=1 Tax=Collybia nuda TaxID=64659 RepID=A0A9P6CI84_9AGAR|nr:hypothetical protein BDZ94DRAFT_1249065 [Collybia nuda]
MASRNESKAMGALTQLESEGLGTGSAIWLKLDLLDPRAVKKAAEEFIGREERLDILVNNAAMMMGVQGSFEKTEDGISAMFSTNYIGPFVFTRTLLPLLTKTCQGGGSDVRIVNVTSASHMALPTVRFRDLNDFNRDFKERIYPSFDRYAHSKLPGLLISRELQNRLDADNVPIIVVAVHPGTVNTFAHRMPFPKLSEWLLRTFASSPDEGSWTSLFAAASPIVLAESGEYKGSYLMPVGKISKGSKQAQSPELAKELWASTEIFLQDIKV